MQRSSPPHPPGLLISLPRLFFPLVAGRQCGQRAALGLFTRAPSRHQLGHRGTPPGGRHRRKAAAARGL
ncbi:hypothetical protein NDU88_000948 [Pleurodeles waltl]|uniref:Uncharacterized protein n=1 Tax=Pleurodeles waltl TaxID=8319 RepID=A0AAV7THR9_PLEWA|nr:hypothetical protein NDU88_000948 [Pleurodeles waltl]